MKIGIVRAIILAICSAAIAGTTAFADETSALISLSKAIKNLKIGGDMRIRQENFWKSSPRQLDRSRQRFRFRLGIQPEFDNIKVGFRMASGTGEQVSTNQSLDNLSSQPGLWIDQAYIQWKPWEWVSFNGGRMANPFWRLYSSDLVFDDDYNPDGFAQQLEYRIIEPLSVFGNFAQIVLDEDSGDNRDQWMFGYQLGAKTKWGEQTKWDFGMALYDLDNERVGTFSQNATQEGNTRFPGSSVSTVTAFFTMLHLNTEVKTRVYNIPVSLQADYVNNLAENGQDFVDSRRVIGSSGTEKVGYQIGLIVGKASAAKSWEAAYFYKHLETNATLADIADSDFGDGGTNRKGHIFWFAYSPRDYVQLKAKVFVTEVLRTDLAPGMDHINRAQFDVSVKF